MIILTTLVKVKEVKTKARSGLINEWELKVRLVSVDITFNKVLYKAEKEGILLERNY